MPFPRKPPLNTVTRSTLEAALNELIVNQRGIDFQRIAVRLARERCPALVASEISKDGGEDAYLLATLPDGKVLSVATSLTATGKKIREDLTAVKNRKPGLDTLWFYTPRAPTTQTIDGWKRAIRGHFAVELEVLTREEIVGQLLDPRFHYLAYHHLGFSHPIADEVRETRELLARGAPERLRQWLAHRVDSRVHAVGRHYVADDGKQPPGQWLSAGEVAGALISGGLFALWGEGGIGKSVALGQLAHAYSHGPTRPLAVLISAPAWARSGHELAAFLGAQFLGEAERFRTGIMSLLEAGELGVFINGWNEVAPEDRTTLAERLSNILHAAPGCPIALASRTVEGLVALGPAAYFRVLPLSTDARATLVRQLASEVLNPLEELTEADRGVDTLSRLPLFLIPLVEALQRGEGVPRTRLALLETALLAMERSPDHAAAWSAPALAARIRPTLGRIAFELSVRGTTEIARAEIEAWIEALPSDAPSEPAAALLERLIQHHVLERDGADAIRFQHEYFQDLLCARHLRAQAARSSPPVSSLAEWLDNRRLGAAWALLIQALAEEPKESEGRAIADRLFRIALDVDLQLAAEWLTTLHGRLAPQRVDELTDRLRRQFTEGGSARRLALGAVFAARLPDFAEAIWRQLESPDKRDRQELDNLPKIPIEALGSNWRARLLQWSPDRRADFVTRGATLANSPDPLALARDFATRDPSPLVQARCIEQIAFEDRAAGEALFAAASDECKGSLLQLGAWDEFSPDVIAPYLPLLEELARYPVTTPRQAQALVYLADYHPQKAVDTYRKQLERALPGAPEYDHALQFLTEHDRPWTAEWLLRQLASGKDVPPNSGELLRELPDRAGLTQLLEDVLAAPTHAEHWRVRALAVLLQLNRRDIVKRCFEEWVRARAEFFAGGPARSPPLGTRLTELEDALANAPIDLLIAGLQAHSAQLQSDEAIERVARLLKCALDHSEDDYDDGSSSAEPLRALIGQLVTRALASADPEGRIKAGLARLIGRTGDRALRAPLEQLIAAERCGRIASAAAGKPLPISIRIFSGQIYIAALRTLTGADAIDALLPLLDMEPFDLCAAAQLVEELDARAGRSQSQSSSQIDWAAIARHHQAVSAAPLVAEAQKVTAALDRRIAQMEKGDTASLQVEARATLEVLRAQIVGHVRTDALLAVPVTQQSIYGLDGWADALVRSGVVLPAAWVEQTLTRLASPSELLWIQDGEKARLVNRCLTALMFSDNPGIATRQMRSLLTGGRPRWLFADLLVPIAVSGIPEQVALLLELMPHPPHDSYWWAWREALKSLPRAARQQLIGTLLCGGVPEAMREVMLSGREQEMALTIAASVEASTSLRTAVEALATSPEAQSRDFAVAVLAQIGDLRAAEWLLSLALSEPALRPRVGRALVNPRWPRPVGGRWPGMPVPRAVTPIRKRLMTLTTDPDLVLRQWAVSVLADIDASVEGAFPLDEPRHPDLASGLLWPAGADSVTPRSASGP